MNGLAYSLKPVPARGLKDRLLGVHYDEHAAAAINNLLASRPSVRDVTAAEVAGVAAKHGVRSLVAFAHETKRLYEVYLRHCLADAAFSASEIEDLNHLMHILGLTESGVRHIHVAVGEEIYREAAADAVAGGSLGSGARQRLQQLRAELELDNDTADGILRATFHDLYDAYLQTAISDQRLSPEEDAELARIARNLGFAVDHDGATRSLLDRYRLYWRIDNADLPVRDVSITLQRGEVAHFLTPSVLYERKKVTRTVAYTGLTVRVPIVAGLSWRAGAIAPLRLTSEEVRPVDDGTLHLTSKRLVFVGTRQTTTIPLNRVLNFTPYDDGLEISKTSGKNPLIGGVNDAAILHRMLTRCLVEQHR